MDRRDVPPPAEAVTNEDGYRVMRQHGLLHKRRRPREPELCQCAAEVIHSLQRARREAERIHGPLGKMPFLVTDNGPSFLARRFGSYLKDVYRRVRIAYRTPTQLSLLERFHETLKQEEVYWRLYDDPAHARLCRDEFRCRYNQRRPRWALVPEAGGDPWVPSEVYARGRTIRIPKWQEWAKGAKEKLDALLQETAARGSVRGADTGIPARISPASCRRAGAFIATPCISG